MDYLKQMALVAASSLLFLATPAHADLTCVYNEGHPNAEPGFREAEDAPCNIRQAQCSSVNQFYGQCHRNMEHPTTRAARQRCTSRVVELRQRREAINRDFEALVRGGQGGQGEPATVTERMRTLRTTSESQVTDLEGYLRECQRVSSICESCNQPQDGVGDQLVIGICDPLVRDLYNVDESFEMAPLVQECTAIRAAAADAAAQIPQLRDMIAQTTRAICDRSADANCPARNPGGGEDVAGRAEDGGGEDNRDGRARSANSEQNRNNQQQQAGMIQALAGLAGQFLQQQTPQPGQPMQPAELPADHCMRPENRNEMVCLCQGAGWSLPQCRQAQGVQAAQAMGGDISAGTGGARLQNPAAGAGGIPPMPNLPGGMPMGPGGPPGNQPRAAGGPAMYAGGGGGGVGFNSGGMRPSGGDQDDNYQGPSISADILDGSRGGPAGAIRPGSISVPRTPENLPGYNLGLPRARSKPDLNQFDPRLVAPPPAPRMVAAQPGTASRTVGGLAIDQNVVIHPASEIIWRPIRIRYYELDHTFISP